MDTYNDLVTSCQQLAEDTSTDFLAYLPTAIELAEARLFRLVDIDFSTIGLLNTTNGVQDISKPADWRVTHNMYIIVDNERQRLQTKTEDYVNDYWPFVSQGSIPKYFAERDANTWILAPIPDGTYPIYVEYEAKYINLSVSNQTSILIERYPDLLLYASMSNVCEWMKDDERKGMWEEKLAEALSSTNNEGMRQRHDDNTNVNNPIGGRNTKVKNGV